MTSSVLFETLKHTLVITLNEPARRNVLSRETYVEVTKAMKGITNTGGVRSVIVRGAEDFFCAGGDLKVLKTRSELALEQREVQIDSLHNMIRAIRACPVSVIAAVEGGAAGAGASLAFACDMIIAARDANFTLAYVNAGLVPDGGGSGYLAMNLPRQLATEMCLTGEPVSAERMHDVGVVNRLTEPGQAFDAAQKLADRIAQGPRQAQASIKSLVSAPDANGFEAHLRREQKHMAVALGGAEAQEGIKAFEEKRKPDFKTVAERAAQPAVPVTETGPLETELTRAFGLRLPVVAGGLMWLADAEYVSAAARAGILGFVTAASFPEPDQLRDEIRKCRDLADGNPFGVNVSMLPKLIPGDNTEEVFRAIIDEGVDIVETSGRSPKPYLPMLKAAGVRVLHKVPSLRHAESVQKLGVDAVAIVGAECGGHPGMEMIGSFVNAGLARRRIHIPWLLGGGVGSGEQILAARAMGASGVVVGTRFLVAEEIWAAPGYKEALIAASERDTALTMHTVRNTVRSLRNETTSALQELERDNPELTIQEIMHLVSGKVGRKAYETGDVAQGILSAGQSLGFVDRIQPLARIVAQLEQEIVTAKAELLDS